MKARLLKKWGGNYAGQVLTNVDKGSIPAGVAEFFEDDDPAVNTVVAQSSAHDPLMVINDEINPVHAKAHNESQRAAAKSSEEAVNKAGISSQMQQLETEQTQERARNADLVAAGIADGQKGSAGLSDGQKENNAAGKGPSVKAGGKSDAKKG
jgi:hypothetical protein